MDSLSHARRVPLRPLNLRASIRTGASFITATALCWGQIVGAAQAAVYNYSCSGGFVAPPAPPVPAGRMTSLKAVPNPVIPGWPAAPTIREDLTKYIADLGAAIRLGKALFWDVRAGSDNKTACASCHFQAGGDPRTKNQINPGPNRTFDVFPQNGDLTSVLPNAPVIPADTRYDDIIGSQGVRASGFISVSRTGVESTTTPTGFRQTTGKNSPSVINSVFNHRQFANGRAQPEFNGVNGRGIRDSSARVHVLDSRGNPVPVMISIREASLASQAVEPATSPIEMSAAGRSLPELGKKLLALKPLGLQKVSPTDSALGALADTTTGLKTSYAAMIQQAFQPKWRSVNKNVSVNGVTYSMMQANFSLYWGLAIMLYEATLVSDDTPMDRYLATRTLDPVTGALISHNPTLLDPVGRRIGAPVTTSGILNGLALFELPAAPPPSFPVPVGFGVGCIACHVGAETTSASIRNLTGGVEPEHGVLKGVGVDIRMERMFTKLNWTPPGPLSPTPLGADKITFDDQSYAVNVTSINNGLLSTPVPLPVATYDAGWYNLGVRPTVEDIGLGGAFASSQIADASKRPLSWTRLFQALPDPSFIKVAGNTLECPGAGNVTFPDQILNPSGMPLLTGPLRKTEATDVDGTFKVTSLRNLEIGGPYFHNGGKSTLAQVMDFYNVGGDFANATKAPAMVPLQLTQAQSDSIVSFMLSLTDDRVLYQKAPFDHPELRLPNGETSGADNMVLFPAVGAAGSITPLPRFLNLNPFQR